MLVAAVSVTCRGGVQHLYIVEVPNRNWKTAFLAACEQGGWFKVDYLDRTILGWPKSEILDWLKPLGDLEEDHMSTSESSLKILIKYKEI